VSFNGTTAYLEAPHGPELNVTDWTFEVWFRDENPTYNHARRRILTKGDVSAAEVPFFASIDSNLLYVGLRSGGAAQTVTLSMAGVSPNAWHHLAASFQASTRTLTIYLDGTPRASRALTAASSGNTLPLIVGRSGTSGDYWLGKLDDLRVWSVVRSATEIANNYRTQLTAPAAGLVGSWRFDDAAGSLAVDAAGVPQNASLLGGATWSADVPQGT